MTSERILRQIEHSFFGATHRPATNRIFINVDIDNHVEIFRDKVKSGKWASSCNLYEFDLSERPLEISFGNLYTRDKGKVFGKITVYLSVIDDDDKIRSVFLDESRQLNYLKHKVNSQIQDFVAAIDVFGIRNKLTDLKAFIYQSKDEISCNQCYHIDSIFIHELEPSDEKIKQRLDNEPLKNSELEDLLHRIKVERILNDFDFEKKEKQKELFKTVEGILSVNPEQAVNYLIEKLKADNSIKDEHINALKEIIGINQNKDDIYKVIIKLKSIL